eukprot:CAMPEP_0184327094 /NCGR_PEP_ID=MMETSP1049-20130417/142913_1 /TAXON_ID=77928 /ORGANISM="Proteomonas sulcata, Strain CCMP704" /LENGTH=262 /DNA_ID=CAMNT_0026649331 /DNA_START=557 /DNA_END=1345 /DNA_ORIENTATION=-
MFEAPLPAVIAHRGACEVAPENTLAAIRASKAMGASWVEIDAMLTKDGLCVVHHDNQLERCTNGIGLLRDHDFSELSLLDAGSKFSAEFAEERIPLLTEVVNACSELDLGINIEVKHANDDAVKPPCEEEIAIERALAQAVCEVLGSLEVDRQRVLISSFSIHALEVCLQLLPHINRSYLVEGLPEDWKSVIDRFQCCSLNIWHEHEDYTRETVERLTKQVPVYAYTVNCPIRSAELKAWGVRGVFSDCANKVFPAFNDLQK